MTQAASIDIRLYSCCIISPFRQSSKGGLLANHLVQWFSQRTKPPFSSRSFQPATVDDARRYVTVLVLTQAGWPLFLQIDICATLESLRVDMMGSHSNMDKTGYHGRYHRKCAGYVWDCVKTICAKSPLSQWTPYKSPKCPPRYHMRHGHCCTVYFPKKRVCHLQE